MMGHRSKRFKLFAETNLEALLPADNFYRRLEDKLDLSFVRDLVRDCYEEVGRPSIDPVVFFKLHLIAFFEGITSERRLMETAHLNLAHRWYLGYDLDEALPDHSSLSKIRSRYGVETFQRFFERIVELCMEAGLVEGEELYFDATKVEADAAMSSLRPRLSLAATLEHVRKVFEEDQAAGEPAPPLGAATGDKTYATLENVKGLEDDGIKAYLPLPDWSRRPGFYGQQEFTYLPERDVYLCPQRKELARASRAENAYVYRARADVCNACPVKSACTNSANGRTIRRPFDQAYIERVQRYHDTGACQRAIRKRQACVEPLFAEAKTLHGLSRFRLRGIEKVNIEGLMVAAGQNLKRLFKYSGMRPAPLALAVLASALLALRRAFVPSAGSGPSRSAASPT